jgi:hypothetical protein
MLALLWLLGWPAKAVSEALVRPLGGAGAGAGVGVGWGEPGTSRRRGESQSALTVAACLPHSTLPSPLPLQASS